MTMKRIEIARNRKFKPGTFRCSNCRTTGHAYLLEGEECVKCHIPKAARTSIKGMNTLPQTQSSLKMMRRVEIELHQSRVPCTVLAERLGVEYNRMKVWRAGKAGDLAQKRIVAELESGFLNLKAPGKIGRPRKDFGVLPTTKSLQKEIKRILREHSHSLNRLSPELGISRLRLQKFINNQYSTEAQQAMNKTLRAALVEWKQKCVVPPSGGHAGRAA